MNTQLVNQSIMDYASAHPSLVAAILVWSIVWKLIALWKAARNNHMTVFIVLGILNLVGVPEIIYLAYLYYKGKKNSNLQGQAN